MGGLKGIEDHNRLDCKKYDFSLLVGIFGQGWVYRLLG
jgi:hypothetical protein